jgi:hypothetical protein
MVKCYHRSNGSVSAKKLNIFCGVCAILLWLCTSIEHLELGYTNPGETSRSSNIGEQSRGGGEEKGWYMDFRKPAQMV